MTPIFTFDSCHSKSYTTLYFNDEPIILTKYRLWIGLMTKNMPHWEHICDFDNRSDAMEYAERNGFYKCRITEVFISDIETKREAV